MSIRPYRQPFVRSAWCDGVPEGPALIPVMEMNRLPVRLCNQPRVNVGNEERVSNADFFQFPMPQALLSNLDRTLLDLLRTTETICPR